ncbi:hypothetical protein [Weissella halotolerans]|nr:hypothetical protein [Weissella halotolerans]
MENLAQGLKRIKPVFDLLGSIDLSLTETELIRPVRVMNKEQATAVYAAHNDGKPVLVARSTNHWIKTLAKRHQWFIERDVLPYYWAMDQRQGPFPWLQGQDGFWPVASNLAGAVAWVNIAYLDGVDQYGSGSQLLVAGRPYYLPRSSNQVKRQLARLKVVSWQMQLLHRYHWLRAAPAQEVLPWLPYPAGEPGSIEPALLRRYQLLVELGHFAQTRDGGKEIREAAAFVATASEPEYSQRIQPDWWWQ